MMDSDINCVEDFIPLENRNQKSKNVEKLKELKEKRRLKRARIIIRNISYKATDKIFQEYFEKFGKINDFQLLKRDDGKLVGCGFIQYETINQAAKAILKANNSKFLGRLVFVDWALGKNEYEKKQALPSKNNTLVTKNHQIVEKMKDEKPIKDESNGNIKNIYKKHCRAFENDKLKRSFDKDSINCQTNESEEHKEAEFKHTVQLEDSKSKYNTNDVKEECTVFIKNVPFDATSDDLRKLCSRFGPIYYALINTDYVSGHSRGTAFVKFKTKDSADLCLRAGNELTLMDQIMETFPALTRDDIDKKNKKNDAHKDSRNLYLIKEGIIMTGSKAAEGVSTSDMAKRHKIEQVKTQVLKNLNRFVSRNRLSIHNLPLDYDDDKLKNMVTKYTQLKCHECRIVRENKPSVGYPKGKSKGFGFMSFRNHQEALIALRQLNNNPFVFGNRNRPIVGFSIEDRSVHNIKKKRLEKSQQNNPFYQKKIEKMKTKKLNKEKKEIKPNLPQGNKSSLRMKNKSTEIENCEEKFMGIPAKPGSFTKMRSNKKINQQSQVHKKKVSELRRKLKKAKEKNQLRQEKKSINRPKQGKKKEEKDNFSILVNKYKNLINSKFTDYKNKPQRMKWYTD